MDESGLYHVCAGCVFYSPASKLRNGETVPEACGRPGMTSGSCPAAGAPGDCFMTVLQLVEAAAKED